MRSTGIKGFQEEYQNEHKESFKGCDDNICVRQKNFPNIIVEIHENYLYLSNIITDSKLSLFLSSF